MSTNIIQSEYDTLDSIAARFGQQFEVNSALYSQVERSFLTLSQEGWEGRGSAAFASEMQSEVLPALQRLNHALSEAQSVTLQVRDVLQEAEEEAARLFGGNGAPGGPIDPNSITPQPNAVAPPSSVIQAPGLFGAAGFGATALGIRAGTAALGWLAEHGKFSVGIPFLKKDLNGNWKFTPNPEFSAGYTIADSVFGNKHEDTWAAGGLSGSHKEKWSALGGELGIGASFDKDGLSAGLSGEFYTAKASVLGVVGDKNLGLTAGGEIEVASAEGFIGIKDNNIGASIGANLISVEGEVGTNIAGVNVGLTGEVGLKAELGFEIGAGGFEMKLPFASFGISFGGAK
jgi:WXG100 family type VII secretion target